MNSASDLRLDWCSVEAAQFACERWHYARACPTTTDMKIGVWEAGRFIGVVLFSRGANHNIGRPYNLRQTEVCELTRVALTTHTRSVSRIIAIALRLLRQLAPGLRLVVSYADPGQGHHGGIYQAGNWIYVGLTASWFTVFAGGKRWHHRAVGTSAMPLTNRRVVKLPRKHKYLMPLDVGMRAQVLPLAQPFPKRERSRDNAAAPPRAEDGVSPIRSLHPDELTT